MKQILAKALTIKRGESLFRYCIACALLMLACIVPAVSRAESMTFTFNNATEYEIDLKFYSRDRNHHWPSMTRAYALTAGSKAKQLKIECNAEERFCYGAWTPHKAVWGAGKSGLRTCENCCHVCKDGDMAKAVTLKQFISR